MYWWEKGAAWSCKKSISNLRITTIAAWTSNRSRISRLTCSTSRTRCPYWQFYWYERLREHLRTQFNTTSIGRSTLCGVYTIKYGCRDERVLWRGRHYFDFDRAPLFDTLSQLHLHATAPGTMAHGLWCLVVLLFRACLYAFSKYGTGTFDNLMIVLTSLSLSNTF